RIRSCACTCWPTPSAEQSESTPRAFCDRSTWPVVAPRGCASTARMRQSPDTPNHREAGMAEIRDPENTLIMDTTQGRVVIEMRPDLAPNHVARIKELARQHFYDGIVFHRVIDGFMAQTGCPHGTGTGGSGKKLAAEFNSEPHVR